MYKEGLNVNSKYWREHKKNMEPISDELFEIGVGTLLGDACMYKISKLSKIKFEQSYIHKEYLFHLYEYYKNYTFSSPYERKELRGERIDKIKSYSFRTFEHISFNLLWDLFYNEDKKKIINPGIIKNYLTARGLAFWIMDDGSLSKDKKTMILHTQGYNYEEQKILSKELYEKFNLNNKITTHKTKYYVLTISSKDHVILHDLISPYIHDSMIYKLPKK